MSNYDTEYDYDDIPWDEIPNGNYMPASIVLAELEMLSDEIANSGKRMFVANFKIIEPEDFYGRKHTERYVVSTDEFPQKFDATTIGAVGLKQMRMAAQMQPMRASELCEYAETVRPQLMFQLKEPKPTDEFQNNSIVKYFMIGEREPEILTNKLSKKGNKPPAQRATPPRQQPRQQPQQQPRQQPQTRQENQKRVTKTDTTGQQAPAERNPQDQQQMSPEPNPEDLVPFEAYEDADTVSYDEPIETAKNAPTDTATATKTTAQEILISCPKCNQEVPSSQMGQHMADHFRQ
jgi:hypothetical protein